MYVSAEISGSRVDVLVLWWCTSCSPRLYFVAALPLLKLRNSFGFPAGSESYFYVESYLAFKIKDFGYYFMCREFRRLFKKSNRYKREVLRRGKESCFFSGGKQNSPHVSSFFSAEDPFSISLSHPFSFLSSAFSLRRKEEWKGGGGGGRGSTKRPSSPFPPSPHGKDEKLKFKFCPLLPPRRTIPFPTSHPSLLLRVSDPLPPFLVSLHRSAPYSGFASKRAEKWRKMGLRGGERGGWGDHFSPPLSSSSIAKKMAALALRTYCE